MAFTTPQMALNVWNLTTDPYDHEELAENWAKVDAHDHSSGKGTKIPTGGIEDAAITAAKLDPAAIPSLTLDDGAVTAAKLGTDAVTTTKIQDGAVTSAKLAGGLVLPVGAVIGYGAASAPTGWLLCDGAEYATGTYPTLYGLIGTAYGSGSGTFKVPDLRGRVPVGVGTHADVNNRGDIENPEVALASRTPYHDHGAGTLQLDTYTTTGVNTGTSYEIGLNGSTATETLPYQTVNYIIKHD